MQISTIRWRGGRAKVHCYLSRKPCGAISQKSAAPNEKNDALENGDSSAGAKQPKEKEKTRPREMKENHDRKAPPKPRAMKENPEIKSTART